MRLALEHICCRAGLTLATIGLLPVCGHTQTGWSEAVKLLDQGEHLVAFAALDGLEAEHAGDLSYDLALGRSAFGAGHFTRAILAYERAYILHPDHAAARAGLVQAMMAVGDAAGVQALVQERLPPLPNPMQTWHQSQFFNTFDHANHQGMASIKGFVALGFGRDSNVNVGPTFGGLSGQLPNNAGTWQLSPNSAPMSAGHVLAAALVSGRWTWDPKWSLTGQISTDHRDYADSANAFDTRQSEASGGISFLQDRHEFDLAGQWGQTRQNHQVARNVSGLQGDWVYRLDGFRQWSTYAQSLAVSYPAQPIRNARRNVAGTTYMRVLRTGASVYGGMYGGQENAVSGAEYFGHRVGGLRMGVQWPLSAQWSIFSTLTHERRTYGANDPFFAVRRVDTQTDTLIGLSWVPSPGWRITPQVLFTRNASSLPVNDHRRRQALVTFRRDF